MKKTDKIIYIILIFLIVFPILIPRLIIEYNLKLYSTIKIGTNIENAVLQIKEINKNNHVLLNFFINRDNNEENTKPLDNDIVFFKKQREKMILSSGLLYENHLKNSYYVNKFFNDCMLIIYFNDKEVIDKKSSCEKEVLIR